MLKGRKLLMWTMWKSLNSTLAQGLSLATMIFKISILKLVRIPMLPKIRQKYPWVLVSCVPYYTARKCKLPYIITTHSNFCGKILYIYLTGYPSNGKLVVKCFLSWTILEMSSLPAFFTISRPCLIAGLLILSFKSNFLFPQWHLPR